MQSRNLVSLIEEPVIHAPMHGVMKCSLLLLAVFASSLSAADWPVWRGPNKTGVSSEKLAGTQVKELWKAQIGLGFASFTVADARVFTSGHADGQDTVFCFDAASGKPVWKHSYKAELGDKYYEGGTSAGPVIEGDKAWHVSRWGDLICFEAARARWCGRRTFSKKRARRFPSGASPARC